MISWIKFQGAGLRTAFCFDITFGILASLTRSALRREPKRMRRVYYVKRVLWSLSDSATVARGFSSAKTFVHDHGISILSVDGGEDRIINLSAALSQGSSEFPPRCLANFASALAIAATAAGGLSLRFSGVVSARLPIHALRVVFWMNRMKTTGKKTMSSMALPRKAHFASFESSSRCAMGVCLARRLLQRASFAGTSRIWRSTSGLMV